jgi:predicted nucleotidyltransferase
MKRQDVIARLTAHQRELERLGIVSLDLFGSVVRDQAGDASDVDLLFACRRPFGLIQLGRATRRISELLDGARIDLVPRVSVAPDLRDRIIREAESCGIRPVRCSAGLRRAYPCGVRPPTAITWSPAAG